MPASRNKRNEIGHAACYEIFKSYDKGSSPNVLKGESAGVGMRAGTTGESK